MKRLQFLLLSSLLTAMMISFYSGSNAQIINKQATQHVSGYDPIVANLDSLLTLTYIQRISQNNLPVNSSLQPFEVPSYSHEVYQQRISKIQTPIKLYYDNEVREYIDVYALKKRQLTERVMGLANLYFPLFEQILDQQGLPIEFKYLSIVESALNPTAVSPAGATGLWQFMHGTGKMYDLKINSFIDERRDPEKATLAACQYFKDMYAIYNDWLLVIAAYNCGAGNVNKAIARSGGKRTFQEISSFLPRETRGYVPAFVAVTYVMTHTNEHNLKSVSPTISYWSVDTVLTSRKTTLKNIADAINIPLDILSYLNPIYKKGIVPATDEPMSLRLPTNKINTYLSNVENIYKPEETPAIGLFVNNDNFMESQSDEMIKKFHKVKRGEHLQNIAKQYHCSVTDIKNWNRLRSNKLTAGQKLTVYSPANNKNTKIAEKTKVSSKENTVAVSKGKNNSGSEKSKSDSRLAWHTVQSGDSLWKIAQRYQGMTVDQIKDLNKLRSNELKVGTKLKVVVYS